MLRNILFLNWKFLKNLDELYTAYTKNFVTFVIFLPRHFINDIYKTKLYSVLSNYIFQIYYALYFQMKY